MLWKALESWLTKSSMKTRPDHSEAAGSAVLHGHGVGPGIVIGVACLHEPGDVHAPEHRIPASRVDAEKKRFTTAVADASTELETLREKAGDLPAQAGEELGFLLDAYGHMLKGSRLIRGVETRIEHDRINAEAAVRYEISALNDAFQAMDDPYLQQRADDIRDIGNKLIRHLSAAPQKAFQNLPRNAVIVSHELTPADTALLDPETVAGFVTACGGAESHTAIMARSLGLPAVLAVPDIMSSVQRGDTIILDGVTGTVVINPDQDTLASYRIRRADFLRSCRNLGRLRDLPAVTSDGTTIRLMANIELPGEIDTILSSGAEGIGLFRSEFMYMNRPDWPDEDEQYRALKTVVQRMEGKPVTIRILDAGGDKLTTALGGSMPANPALGLRAVRFLLSSPAVLEAQLAAILRVAVHGPVRILVPMVCTVSEITAVRECLGAVHSRLKKTRIPVPDTIPPLGVMIEVPGAALAADALATASDFFAIGTNDLTQYTLAIDRTDQEVAHLYNPTHPAVLRLIHFTTGAALRAGIPVSVCGEIAGDPRLAALLVGIGIRELSMAAGSLPRVKNRIRHLAYWAAEEHARQVMSEHDPTRIETMIEAFG